MRIRTAAPADSAALLAIYRQYIETPITFEYVLPTIGEFAGRISEISHTYPYLVCGQGDKLVAYAYAHRAMERAAYQWNAELSVYIDQQHTSRGLGTKLYACLLELLKLQGIKTALAAVTAPNPRSDALHRAFGFEIIGRYRNTGYKCGGWHDVVIYSKQLAPYTVPPAPLTPFSEIPPEQLSAVLDRFNAEDSAENNSPREPQI